MRLIPGDWNNPRPNNTDKQIPPDANPNNDTIDGGYNPRQVRDSVFPYRGQEMHGVAPVDDPWQRGDDEHEFADNPAPSVVDPEPEPVPVRIVRGNTAREIRSWNATQMMADGTPRQLIGRNQSRTKVHVKNLSAEVAVYIGRQNTTNYMSGYPIDPGQSISLESTDEIFGVTGDTTKTALIALMWEHTVVVEDD